MNTLIAGVLAPLLVIASQAAPATSDGPSVAGTWVVSIESHELGLGLEQDHSHLTGTLVVMGQQMPVTGEFKDGKISVTTDPDGATVFRLTGTLNGDGTIAGELESPHGAMKFTAERLKPRA